MALDLSALFAAGDVLAVTGPMSSLSSSTILSVSPLAIASVSQVNGWAGLFSFLASRLTRSISFFSWAETVVSSYRTRSALASKQPGDTAQEFDQRRYVLGVRTGLFKHQFYLQLLKERSGGPKASLAGEDVCGAGSEAAEPLLLHAVGDPARRNHRQANHPGGNAFKRPVSCIAGHENRVHTVWFGFWPCPAPIPAGR